VVYVYDLTLRRLKQEDREFKASLGYTVRSQTNKKRRRGRKEEEEECSLLSIRSAALPSLCYASRDQLKETFP
jgi:hypothetical protein